MSKKMAFGASNSKPGVVYTQSAAPSPTSSGGSPVSNVSSGDNGGSTGTYRNVVARPGKKGTNPGMH